MTTALAGVLDISEDDYFASPALSSSGIKALLPPSCPAKFRYGVREHKSVFDIGSAAHKLVLGSGPEIEAIDADDWRKKETQQRRDAAYEVGRIPILRKEYEHVQAMAAALWMHPVARALFDPDHGLPERSLFWRDDEFDIDCRARLDWLPDPRGGRLIVPDFKTCEDASDEAAMKAVGNFSYHVQAAHYMNGVVAAGLDDDPAFLFVFQEKKPPYLVNIVQLDTAAIESGRIACRAAAEIYRDCLATDIWPGYPLEISEVSLPPWKTRIPEEFYTR